MHQLDQVNPDDKGHEWDVDPTRFWRPNRRPVSPSNNGPSGEDFYPGGFVYGPLDSPTVH
jgi:hypothetical protein